MWTRTFQLLGAAALLTLAAACGGGGDGGGAGTGTLRLALADNPTCGYDEVNVTVEKVRLHQSEAAGDGAAGWQEITLDTPQTLNLLHLTNGVLEELGQTALPAGTYTQVRLVLAPNTGNQADKNWIVLTDDPSSTPIALKTPSGQQSGLKINVGITVAADQLADIVLDVDACKSVVMAGGSGQYLFKPVVRAIPRTQTGVLGEVSLALAGAGATVSLQQDGVVKRATVADIDGQFKLQPVEPGIYTLVVVAPGHATAVVKQVEVGSGQLLRVAPVGEKIDPPVSATATIDGTVATGEAEINASVALLQSLTAGPDIRLIDRVVDSVSGAYELTDVPVAAPVVAGFAAGASLTFVPDNGRAGIFTLRATAGDQTDTVDLGPLAGGDTASQDFTFP